MKDLHLKVESTQRRSGADLKQNRILLHPKTWGKLNMIQIEINTMDRECLARRIGVAEKLISIGQKTKIRQRKKHWKFTKQDADKKSAKH